MRSPLLVMAALGALAPRALAQAQPQPGDPAPPAADPAPPVVDPPPIAPLSAPASSTRDEPSSHHDWGNGHYEILARDNWVRASVALVNLNQNDGAAFGYWYPTQAFGVQVIEHGGGPISFINAFFLAVAGASYSVNRSTGEVRNNASMGPLGQEASWTFDYSQTYWSFRADSWWFKWLGWRFGLWNLREISNDDSPGAMLNDPTKSLLSDHNANYVQNSGGVEIELLLRYPIRALPIPGRLTLELDVPVTYLLGEWAVGLGVLDKDMRYTIYADGGVPRLSAHLAEQFGPIAVQVIGSVPTIFLAIPYLVGGAQLTLSAGVRF